MRRLTLTMALVAAVLAVPIAAGSAAAAPSYDDAVDITIPAKGSYSNDYYAGRAGGRVHRATDIFNEMGTPVHAAVGGTVTWAPTSEHSTAGFALQIRGDDGRTYAYYHLGEAGGSRSEALASGIDSGVQVERGQLIGYLGNSGNARNTPPHLHFEIHAPNVADPNGTDRINPYGSLRAAEARGDYPGGSSASSGDSAQSAGADGGEPTTDGTYTVERGDTLSMIARAHALDGWRTLAELNPELADPNVILPGQVLRVPAD